MRKMQPSSMIVLAILTALMLGLLFAPVFIHVKIRIASHRQKVITIKNTPTRTIVGEKEVIYYHKGR